jgi:hypothetical protein
MRRHARARARNQLVLDLERGGRLIPPSTAPEGLLQALADLLLEALGKQTKAIPNERETSDAAEDHA